MNAVRKYKWKIQVTSFEPHPALQDLLQRTFEMETFDPPPDVGQRFVLFYDAYAKTSGPQPGDRCVEVEVVRRKQLMTHGDSNAYAPDWFVMLYANIAGKADLPW